jgi:thiamine-monophosphate kinase
MKTSHTHHPTLADIGEIEAIARIQTLLDPGGEVIRGIGDDCAVVRPAGDAQDWVLTSDPVIEAVHFDRGTPPEAIGHKAVGRVLSDLAAMGAAPCWALIDLGAPRTTPMDTLLGFYRGVSALAGRYGLAVVGGDMSDAPVFEAHVFGVGRVPSGTAVLRIGAAPGDGLYVTGRLGGSRLGRHLAFEPRVREGQFLRDWASAMLDLSDGLGADLPRLAEAGRTGFVLDLGAVPVSNDARRAADADGLPPLRHALSDGEDFELLFTVPARKEPDFMERWRTAFELPCTRIGVAVEAGRGVVARAPDGREGPLSERGFTHWARP